MKTPVKTVRKEQEVPVPVNRLLNYKHRGLVQRLQEKEGMSKQNAENVFKDMLRFLYLCGTSDQIFGPSEKIAVAWHHFILFTRDYAKFCQSFFGRFVHHSPVQAGKRPINALTAKETLAFARGVFGELSANWAYSNVSPDCDKCSGSTNCQDGDCHDS